MRVACYDRVVPMIYFWEDYMAGNDPKNIQMCAWRANAREILAKLPPAAQPAGEASCEFAEHMLDNYCQGGFRGGVDAQAGGVCSSLDDGQILHRRRPIWAVLVQVRPRLAEVSAPIGTRLLGRLPLCLCVRNAQTITPWR